MAFTHPVSIVSRSHSMAEHALSPHQRSFSYPLEDLRSAQTRFTLRQLYDLPKSWPAALVSRWVHECTLEHALCRNEGRKPIAGLWLIECNTLQIVPAPAEPSYVALSYVWGKFRKTPQDTPHGSLPSPLPLLISDAIEVCRQLGFQYLWVDKYCIDQNNPQVKHNQIQQMDLVYRNGQLTIIAAAGKDETYGLPGVSSCPRRTLPTRQKRPRALSTSEDPACGIKCYCDGNLSTTSTILDVQRAVLRSKWSTRGWTYQEGSLSRRCLAFTDEQVYFECDSGICYCEAPGTVETSSEAAVGIFRTLVPDPRNSFDRQYLALLGAIEEYSKRELTYDSDILYAFAGIMRRYQSLSPSIKQIAGLPFIVQDAQGGVCEINIGDSDDIEVDLEMDGSSPPPPVHDLDWDLKQQLKDTSFPYGLAWAHKHSCWEEDHVKPRRRGQLPSWAWPEWAGEVTFCWWGTIRLNDFQPFIEDIKVELRDGKVMPYQDLPYPAAGSHQQDGQTLAPQALLFKSIPIPPRLVDVKWANRERVEWSVCGFRTSLSLSAGADSPFRFRKDLVKRGLFELVILGGDGDWKPPSREHSLLLVLGRHGQDWVRCGVMRVDCSLRELLDALVEHDVFPYYERKKVYRVE